MSGFLGNDSCLQPASHQRQVAHYIQQFVPCGFVVVVDGGQVPQFGGIQMWLPEFVGQIIQAFLRHRRFVNDECILQITAFD